MPSVPKESLGKRFSQSKQRLESLVKDTVYVYAIFAILILEICSLFLRELETYVDYWYPLLSQITLFVVLFSTYLKSDAHRFCQRRKIAFLLLSIYFAFGATSIIFQIKNQFYLDIATFILLGGVFSSILLTLFKKK